MAEKIDKDFAAKMLQIRGGKVRASEARKISNRTIKLTDSQIHDQIADAARNGCYSSAFDPRQITDTARKDLEQLGYRLIEDKYTVTVAWNLIE